MSWPPLIVLSVPCIILAIYLRAYAFIVPIVVITLLYQYVVTRAYLGEPFVGATPLSVKNGLRMK